MKRAKRSEPEVKPVETVEAGAVSAAARSPLYHQIYLILRDGIVNGTHKPGALLPSEHELTRRYGVSRITAARALDELAEAGLVRRRRGHGTVVSYRPESPPLRASVSNWLQAATSMGRATRVDVVDFGYGAANEDEAEALRIEPGVEVQRSVRVRSHEQGPFSLLTAVVPGELGRTYEAADLAGNPLLSLLERAGIAVDRARQVITATLATQAIAAHLHTEVGAALIKLQRVVVDTEGRPVEFLTALYRPDRYQLEMVLTSAETVSELGGSVEGVDRRWRGR